ncbi:hypothetical protein EDB89DRAFT_1906296 [Lactarius sanguifluus]|nr:hypothetical protein EDB89DRAFT_1906296 [Lactarius sanguifluus]
MCFFSSSGDVPPGFVPRVEDLIRGAEDRSIWLIRPLLPSNPMVLFKDTEMGQGSFTSPQEVLEVQGAGGDISCSREGRVQDQVVQKQRWLREGGSRGSGVGFLESGPRHYSWNVVVVLGCWVRSGRCLGRLFLVGGSGVFSGFLGSQGSRRKIYGSFLLGSEDGGVVGGVVIGVCRGFTVYAGVNEVGVWIGQGCFPGCFSPGIGEVKFFYEVDWIPVLELTDDIVLMRGNVVEPEVVSSGPKLEGVGSDVRKVPEEELVVARVDYC